MSLPERILARFKRAEEKQDPKTLGKGKFHLPDDHTPFMVFKGATDAQNSEKSEAFSCANCSALVKDDDGTFKCANSDYKTWMGTDLLVDPKTGERIENPNLSCSDWFTPKS